LLEGCPIVSPERREKPSKPGSGRQPRRLGIPDRLLLACGPLGPRLPPAVVADGLAAGIDAGGRPEPDVCLLTPLDGDRTDVRELLDELDFDVRMRRARAVVIGAERLQERTLAGSVTFEIATRARQGGIPAYAVTGENALSAFDARILDLQVIVQARGRGALVTAGRRLAELS
jgi:glycerate 2-kinase